MIGEISKEIELYKEKVAKAQVMYSESKEKFLNVHKKINEEDIQSPLVNIGAKKMRGWIKESIPFEPQRHLKDILSEELRIDFYHNRDNTKEIIEAGSEMKPKLSRKATDTYETEVTFYNT